MAYRKTVYRNGSARGGGKTASLRKSPHQYTRQCLAYWGSQDNYEKAVQASREFARRREGRAA
jgi:hypothetical protein